MARQTVYELLPDSWRRLDTENVLERFLNVWEYEFDTVASKIERLLSLKNPNKIEDKYLRLLGVIVGHEWDGSKSHEWNRNRIKNCINRHSYKGTTNRLSDDMVELGAESVSVQDNASKLLILSKQGRLSEPDSYMVTANFWHDGAYVLRVVDSVVPSLLRSEVEPVMRKTVPAGTIWYLQYGRQLFSIWEMDVRILHGQAIFTGDERNGLLGYGQLITDYYADTNTFLSWLPNRQVQKSYYPIVWHYKGNVLEGTLGNGLLGENVFLSFCPAISLVKSYIPVSIHEFEYLTEGESDIDGFHTQYLCKVGLFDCEYIGVSRYTNLPLSSIFEVTASNYRTDYIQKIDTGDAEDSKPQITTETAAFAVAQGYLTGDSNLPGNIDTIDGNQGTPDIPLTEHQASLQTASSKIIFEPTPFTITVTVLDEYTVEFYGEDGYDIEEILSYYFKNHPYFNSVPTDYICFLIDDSETTVVFTEEDMTFIEAVGSDGTVGVGIQFEKTL